MSQLRIDVRTEVLRDMIAHQLIGRSFGRWTVLARDVRTITKTSYWLCRCECGAIGSVRGQLLVRGDSTHCGCVTGRQYGSKKIHGHARNGSKAPSRTYRTWRSMLTRCYKENSKTFANYGGRGITVCESWRQSFKAFLADMGERPPGTSIDRFPDNNGNYEPGNCRWATPSEQLKNRRPPSQWKGLPSGCFRHHKGKPCNCESTRGRKADNPRRAT